MFLVLPSSNAHADRLFEPRLWSNIKDAVDYLLELFKKSFSTTFSAYYKENEDNYFPWADLWSFYRAPEARIFFIDKDTPNQNPVVLPFPEIANLIRELYPDTPPWPDWLVT